MQPDSPLDNLPLTAPKDGMPVTASEFLSGVQLASSLSDILVDYPASMLEGEESIPANTRIPAHWVARIEEMREKIGGRTSNRQLWPTRGHFYRWSIAQGMRVAREVEKIMKAEGENIDLDPILEMQNFVERTAGELSARAQAMAAARSHAKAIGEGLADLILRGEPEEAADIVLKYSEGAVRMKSPFWRRYAMESLIGAPGVAKILVDLIDDEHITDEVLVGMYENLAQRRDHDAADPDDGVDTPVAAE